MSASLIEAIEHELGLGEALLASPPVLQKLKAQRIARAVAAWLKAERENMAEALEERANAFELAAEFNDANADGRDVYRALADVVAAAVERSHAL